MKDLRRISVVGLGLLGGSIALAIQQHLSEVTVVGYSHRRATRQKARDLAVATEIVDDFAAAGTATIWSDVLLSNADNIAVGIDHVVTELSALREAIEANDKKQIEALLEGARRKRAALVKYKIQKKELLS